MANIMTFNNFLNTTIGLNDAGRVLKCVEHGLDGYKAMAELNNDDIKIMMNGIRKDPDDPVSINAIMEKRTKIACMLRSTAVHTDQSPCRLQLFEPTKD